MTERAPGPKIVVSYRRSDSAMAGRIFDRLAQRFGKTSLFIDIDNIPYGVNFRDHIAEALGACDVLIAVVGNNRLGATDGGKHRIDEPDDPVRVEIETALRQGLTIVPVLIDGATMPRRDELPETLSEFPDLNAAEVESGKDFEFHMQRLGTAVEEILGPKAHVAQGEASSPTTATWPARQLKAVALAVAVLLAIGLGAYVWQRDASGPVQTAATDRAALGAGDVSCDPPLSLEAIPGCDEVDDSAHASCVAKKLQAIINRFGELDRRKSLSLVPALESYRELKLRASLHKQDVTDGEIERAWKTVRCEASDTHAYLQEAAKAAYSVDADLLSALPNLRSLKEGL